MNRYKITLTSFDPENEDKDIETVYIIDAANEHDAISKAKIKLQEERPNIHPAKSWAWSSYETHEK